MQDRFDEFIDTEVGESKKIGVFAIACLVVSAMIGGEVYNLPQNMAQNASVGAILIAWVITGIGMWFITNTFRILSIARPEAKTGIYAYGELGFGRFTGFFSAWGYWICNSFGNVGFAILLMDTLNYFFPSYFTGGNNVLSIVCGSLILWIIYFIVLSGTQQTSLINIVGTIGKLVPLAIFILIMIISFKGSILMTNFWGLHADARIGYPQLGSVLSQVKSTMMVTLWVFTGIEGAVVISARAKSQKDVGKATLLGFILCLLLYAALSILPLGVYPQGVISPMAPPSTGQILSNLVGKWGGIIMNIGVIIAVLSSWLIWTTMLSELPFAAAKKGTFPKIFAKQNKNEAPSFSLLVSTIIMQIVLILVHFAGNAWNVMLSITSVMAIPCYLLSTLYLFKVAISKKEFYPTDIFASRTYAKVTGFVGSIFGFWMLYSGGPKYVLLAVIIFAIGIPIFCRARKEQAPNEAKFTKLEKVFVSALIVISIFGIVYLFFQAF